jgi:hypothetical protein
MDKQNVGYTFQKEINSYLYTTWMNLEAITVSEINQSHKDYHCMTLIIQSIMSSQIHRNRIWNGDCQGMGEV